MGFFKDDFYSTKVKRSSREPSGSWNRPSRWGRHNSALKIALVSSLASSVLVASLFYLTVDRPKSRSASPALSSSVSGGYDTNERIISAAAKVGPVVVSVINQTQGGSANNEAAIQEGTSLGSGVIFLKQKGKAYMITNAHVIADSVKLQVVLSNGTKKTATVVGKDTITDLAVLETDDKGISQVADIGDSGKLRKGETVIAVGNPLGFSDSLSNGIVSNLKTTVPISLNQDGVYDWEEEVIQISAPINPGNSGGALVNLNGQVVGINSMKVADTSVEGIGFSIPIDDAMPIVEQLMEHGKIKRPYLGVYSMDLSIYLDNQANSEDEVPSDSGDAEAAPESNGDDDVPMGEALVVPKGVSEGVVVLEAVGPAKAAGLAFNDIIVALDDQPISSTLDLRKYLYTKTKIGDTLAITYYRDGKKSDLRVKLVEKTENDG
ncbi:S1C family serine protease [Cohnella rhizosphaerae]|uniref:Trypsin-like peptidase domain-containing protein n=1 Tax=Cohnella rhizosphaerae TaxID=1457232 RepID=A0A9X4QU36_9BACL|nr:trypsin-like peptidase domain-containing protein [Cohnella rhizosphaerae]MDG0811064.1 trypsin-like peptidase domain-containing protein [Cohnella rhizosphaerae]